MSNRVRSPLFVTLLCITVPFGVHPNAGEFGGVRFDAESIVLEEQVNIPEDSGIETIYTEQSKPNNSLYSMSETAFTQLQKWASDNGYSLGWDSKKRQYLGIEYGRFDTDPATDKDFFLKRDIFARRAILRAKIAYLRFVGTRMSAREQITIPGTKVHDLLNREARGLEAKAQEIAEQLGIFERIETEALEGVTLFDRIDAILNAVAQYFKLDYDPEKRAVDRRERYDAVKVEHTNLQNDYKSLLDKAEAIRTEVTERWTSELDRKGSLNLHGATVLQQAESLINGQYEVAVLLCWSPRLQQAAMDSLTAKSEDMTNGTGLQSIRDWIKTRDFAIMIGPRQFLDNEGHRNFIGISSRPVMRSGILDERSRDAADRSAELMITFSLISDLRLKEAVVGAMNVHKIEGLDQDATLEKAAETIEQTLSQSFTNMQVHGIQQIWGTRMRHPLANVDMHVRVFLMSAKDATTAAGLQQSHAQATDIVMEGQARLREQADAARRRVEEAMNTQRSSFSQGRAAERAAERQENPNSAHNRLERARSREGALMDRGLVENNW